ncbi:MAG: hypothetical protein KDE27_32510, partial [Planctomycetes bacterium]|nr:hypothetical protein [Planctomycetota bacterium]
MSIDLRPIRTATTTLAILPLLAAPAAAQRILGNSNPNAYVSPIWLQVVPFAASDHTTGQELWGLDVNTLGVAQIADLRPGPEGSSPSGFAYRPNAIDLFFAADNGVNGRELWRTDGTVSGTMMVADIHPAGSSRPTDLVGVGSNVFFVADDGATGRELWRSDGNTTTLVRDIRPNGDSDPRDLVDFNGVLFFSADDGVGGRELWRSDGTPVGTFLVRDLFLGGSSNPRDLTVAGGRLFFAANNAGIGRELHTSDGTAGGTGPVADIRPGGASSTPAMLTGAALPIYFSADDGVHGRELWRSDGTPAGTTLVGDIRPGAASSRIDSMIMAPAAAGVWFVADDGVTGRELWSATGAGAAPLPQLVAGPGSADPTHLTPAGLGIAVFRATTPANGTELWASDGTVGGTGIVADIRPGTRGSRVLGLAPTVALFAGNSFGAMFAADDGSTGLELWRTNGTPAGTTLAANIAPDLPGG